MIFLIFWVLTLGCIFIFFFLDQATSGSVKSKKASTQASGRSGDSTTERNQRAASSRSQPLNLSQVTAFNSMMFCARRYLAFSGQRYCRLTLHFTSHSCLSFQLQQSVMPSSHEQTASSSSLRRQPTYPPPVSSHSSYRLHESTLFGSTPNLYAYPASAALASVSQAVDQMQGGTSRHGRASGAYSSLALLQKNSSLALGGSAPGQYGNNHQQQQQQQQLAAQPFQRSGAAYQRKLNQYPYLWTLMKTKLRPRLETSTSSSQATVIGLFLLLFFFFNSTVFCRPECVTILIVVKFYFNILYLWGFFASYVTG